LVETQAVVAQDDELTIDTHGLVVPFREIELSAQVRGAIVRKNLRLRAGNYVEQDEVLLEIDPRRYDLEIERLKKLGDQTTADLRQLDVEQTNLRRLLELARETLALQEQETERFELLRGRNAISEQEVNEIHRSEIMAREALLKLDNGLREIEARRSSLQQTRELVEIQLRTAELDRSHTLIRSPVSGMVIQDLVEEHAVVQEGTRLAVIEDTSRAEVRCNLKMDDLYWIWKQDVGGRVDRAVQAYGLPPVPVGVVYLLASTPYRWQGVLSRQDGFGLDERTRTVPCRVVVDQPQSIGGDGPPTLMRGMFVTLEIRCRPERELLQIPETAIRPGDKVWLVRGGQLTMLPVRIVRIHQGLASIDGHSSSIVPGDQLITSPVPNAFEGMPVRFQPPSVVSLRPTGDGRANGRLADTANAEVDGS